MQIQQHLRVEIGKGKRERDGGTACNAQADRVKSPRRDDNRQARTREARYALGRGGAPANQDKLAWQKQTCEHGNSIAEVK